MRALVRAKLRRKSTDPLSGLSDTFLNEYIATWDAYFIDHAKWTFRRASKIVSIVAGDQLNGAITTASPTFAIDSSSKLTATGGRVSIEGDEIDYSSASGATATVSAATGAKGIDVSHADNALVDFLIPYPSDFGKPGELWVGDAADPARVKLTHVPYSRRAWPLFPNYASNDGYLYLPRNLAHTRGYLAYYRKAFKTGASEDLQTPRQWDNFVLWCVMAECLQVEGKTSEADYYFNLAGIRTPRMQEEPAGILQAAEAEDAEQTHSDDEFFMPDW